MNRIRFRRIPRSAQRQRGVVLYVALVLLILLTLLGIAGMQVSAMQERMSAGWRASNVAFQNGEAQVKTREIAIVAAPAGVIFPADDERCNAFDPAVWAETEIQLGEVSGNFVRRIDRCSPGGGLAIGKAPESEDTNTQFQISAYGTDVTTTADDRSAEAVIDSIFIP